MWEPLPQLLLVLVFAFAWVGHACLWVSLLSNLYGRSLPRGLLKLWRLFTGVWILAFPAVLLSGINPAWFDFVNGSPEFLNGTWGWFVVGYTALCAIMGGVLFPAITAYRFLRKPPACVRSERTQTLDLWPEYGAKLIGDGHFTAVARVPGNGLLRVDFTDLTLALPDLPIEWNGLTLLVISDLHFHGTPARPYFDRVMDELLAKPEPDLVCLIGDYVDTDTHHEWIGPVLGRLKATTAKLAILGNHDRKHNPEQVRAALTAAGYDVLGNGWRELSIRGVPCVAVGHEGPWFTPPPDLANAPPEPFRLCLSHSPDHFYWGIANHISLMLCGHVHGGAIRLPVIGSIFVPSVYGRRFDQGVFEKNGTAMVVNRGLSGKEPVRFRCNPQVMRVTLVRR